MSDPETEIILHAYPQSPVAEKARVCFGIKGLNWRAVDIPRLPPKPFLTKLTGGYRRTPVVQIGADIYCDSQCVIHELEKRYPKPSFYPTADAGLIWCLSRWTDGDFFDTGVKIILGANMDNLPPDFAEDRGRLYLGPEWAEGLRAANADLPRLVAKTRTPLAWLNAQLGDGRAYLLGDAPGAIDAQIYYVIWFLRGRWDQGPAFLSEFPHLENWENRMRAIGHGQMIAMEPEDAIARAKSCTPRAISGVDAHDPQGLQAGMQVYVSPDVDGGEQPVEGHVVAANANTITLHRNDPDTGDLHVHFPRAGYVVKQV